MSTLERFFVYAMLASPAMLCVLLASLVFSSGIVVVISIIVGAGVAWLARGWKDEMDREDRIRNYRIEP